MPLIFSVIFVLENICPLANNVWNKSVCNNNSNGVRQKARPISLKILIIDSSICWIDWEIDTAFWSEFTIYLKKVLNQLRLIKNSAEMYRVPVGTYSVHFSRILDGNPH